MKIVAIGGGEIGRPGTRREIVPIDREVIRLSGKKHPRVLFLPTASGDSQSYVDIVSRYYGDFLDCRVEALTLLRDRSSKAEIAKRLREADIIYVGGGNTLRMMKLWRRLGIDTLLERAAERGAVLAGISAGGVCWFLYGNSDSRKMLNPSADYIRVRGLGFVPLYLVPHYDAEPERQVSIKRMLRGKRAVAIGVDNGAAVCVEGASVRLIAVGRAGARVLYWRSGEYHDEPLRRGSDIPIESIVACTGRATIRPLSAVVSTMAKGNNSQRKETKKPKKDKKK